MFVAYACGIQVRLEPLVAEAEKLHRQLDRYTYGATIRAVHGRGRRSGARRGRADRV